MLDGTPTAPTADDLYTGAVKFLRRSPATIRRDAQYLRWAEQQYREQPGTLTAR